MHHDTICTDQVLLLRTKAWDWKQVLSRSSEPVDRASVQVSFDVVCLEARGDAEEKDHATRALLEAHGYVFYGRQARLLPAFVLPLLTPPPAPPFPPYRPRFVHPTSRPPTCPSTRRISSSNSFAAFLKPHTERSFFFVPPIDSNQFRLMNGDDWAYAGPQLLFLLPRF